MDIRDIIKYQLESKSSAYGARIKELKLAARDKLILDKIFPLDNASNIASEEIWVRTTYFSKVVFSYILIFILIKIALKIGSFSVNKTLLFCGLISLILSSGPSVFLSKERIEKLDRFIVQLVNFIEFFTKYSMKNSLCLSNKSPHEIQYKYVVYPWTFIVFSSFASIYMMNLVLDKDGVIYEAISSFFLLPSQYLEANTSWFSYMGLSIVIYFSLIYGPNLNVEKLFLDKKVYKKYTRKILLYNLFVTLLHVSAIIVPIFFLHRKSCQKDCRVNTCGDYLSKQFYLFL